MLPTEDLFVYVYVLVDGDCSVTLAPGGRRDGGKMFGEAARRRRHTLGTRGRFSVWRRARLVGLRTVATSTPVRFLGSQPDPRAAPREATPIRQEGARDASTGGDRRR